jgi:hypothetical protein
MATGFFWKIPKTLPGGAAMVNPTFADYVDVLFNLSERFWQHDAARSHRGPPLLYAHKALIVCFLRMHQRRLLRFKAQRRWLRQHREMRPVWSAKISSAHLWTTPFHTVTIGVENNFCFNRELSRS